jgi:hypothetical protein
MIHHKGLKAEWSADGAVSVGKVKRWTLHEPSDQDLVNPWAEDETLDEDSAKT